VALLVEESFDEFGSVVVVVTVAVLSNVVPSAALLGMLPMSVKVAVWPEVSEAMVQVIVPLFPTAGVEQLNPGPLF
jgi:hypothetical protein